MSIQKLALVNTQTREIVSVFNEDTQEILVPDHPNAKPVAGLNIGQYRVVRVRSAEVPPNHEVLGFPTYALGVDDVVHENAQFIRVGG